VILNINGSTIRKRELVAEAAYFFKDRLMPRMKTLEIHINLNPHYEKKTTDSGDCIWEDTNRYPREFTINLDSHDDDWMVQTLAHEMVHVKQWARGEMMDCYDCDDGSPTKTKWKSKYVNIKTIEYEDWPWEKEALRIEKRLYDEWLQHLKQKKV
jgi:hypothetical protein|tara:strand:+ start:2138 stop:2602 length:465 start_codon:yes stop_codon:yes gene_type:complete